jgi:adenylate cyclase class IV
MAKELKIRISDPAAVEAQLAVLGAQFQGENSEAHIYLHAPEGSVIKLVESPDMHELIEFKAQGSGFVRTRQEMVSSAAKRDLENQYGVDGTLLTRSRDFTLGDVKFSLYHIDNVGEFLIQTAETPDPAYFDQLGLANPEYITVPFQQLPKLS